MSYFHEENRQPLFSSFDEVAKRYGSDGKRKDCKCGKGYCDVHGTFHFAEDFEDEVARQRKISHYLFTPGRRAIRKPKGEE